MVILTAAWNQFVFQNENSLKSAVGKKTASMVLVRSLKTCGSKVLRYPQLKGDQDCLSRFQRTGRGFLRVVRRGLTPSYTVKLLQRWFELHIRKQFPAVIVISTEWSMEWRSFITTTIQRSPASTRTIMAVGVGTGRREEGGIKPRHRRKGSHNQLVHSPAAGGIFQIRCS